MSITVRWNRDYNSFSQGYTIYRGTSRNGPWESSPAQGSSVLPSTQTQFTDVDGGYNTWYVIRTIYSDPNNPGESWTSSDAQAQYFCASPIAEYALRVYEDVAAPGSKIHVMVACPILSGNIDILLGNTNIGTLNTDAVGYATGVVTIPSTTTTGSYTISAMSTGTVLDIGTQDIIISSSASNLISVLEDDILTEFQAIKVHNEGVQESNLGNSIYKFSFQNWNMNIQPEFYVDGTELYTSTPVIDFTKGMVGLYNIYQNNDVFANYAFRFFTQAELKSYLDQACNELNLIKPFTEYTLESMPVQWTPLVVQGAYRWALRRILQALIFRDMRLATIGDGAVSIIQALLNEATTTWNNIRKDAKRRGMVQPGVIISGRYRMPVRVGSFNWQQYAGIVQ